MGSFEISIGTFGGYWEMHRSIPGICIIVGTIHTSPLPISGMRQFSAIYYYARSARLREYFDRAARLLMVTSPILFDHSLLNNFASRKKPNMMKSVLCAKQYSTRTRCTTSDVKLASVRVPRVLALS